jgi:ribosomal protein L11 methylase PrmA
MNPDPGSFRDRSGRVYRDGDRVLRGLSGAALEAWQLLESSGLYASLREGERIVGTRLVPPSEVPPPLAALGWRAVLEHDTVPFVSHPWEWPFEMLRDAALLELDVLDEALAKGMILRDGTAHNVQFIGSRPVFIDLPSIGPYRPGETWAGYRQFCSEFLNPLLLESARAIPCHVLLRGALGGIPPGVCAGALSARDLLRRGVLTHVWLHAKADTRYRATGANVRSELAMAGFSAELVKRNSRSLRRAAEALAEPRRDSAWEGYETSTSYSAEDTRLKEEVVRKATAAPPARLVWDLGANTGHYSMIAAEAAACVVAIDSDAGCVGRLYSALRRAGDRRILPLIGDVTDPSPGLGWRLGERGPLEARGRPDVVLALALVHHVVLHGNVRTEELADWLMGLGPKLVVEFVTKDDPMSKRLLLNRDDQFDDYDLKVFESALERRGRIVERHLLCGGTRVLLVCAARTPDGPAA